MERVDKRLTKVGLELTLWQGHYKGANECWLRWQTAAKQLILTGKKGQLREAQARQEAEQARLVAERQAQAEAHARQDAEQARFDAEQRALSETQARLAVEAELACLKALLTQRGRTG